MRAIVPSNKFKKDLKRCLKRGLPEKDIKAVITLLGSDKSLPATCRPHKLVGDWVGYLECHLAPDWLLIYYLDDEHNTLDLIRTGTHADLFK